MGKTYPQAQGEEDGVPYAYPHPEICLPHQIQGNLDDVFPQAEAQEELEEIAEASDPLEDRGLELGKGKQGDGRRPTAAVDGKSKSR